MVRTLAGRRDRIARNWFDKIPPVDFFAFDGGAFSFRDLGVERGIYPAGARYRVRLAAVDADRRPGAESPWMTTGRLRFPLDRIPFASALDRADAARYPFLAFTVRVDRGDGWSLPVTAYASRKSGRVVALER